MDPIFPRTLRALEAERPWISGVSLLLLGALCAAWLAWSFGGSVSISELTSEARLEVREAVFPLQAPVQGRIDYLDFTVGQTYEEGAVLVRFEHGQLSLELEAQLQAVADLQEELRAVSDRPRLERDALASQLRAADEGIEAARSELREAGIAADQARADAARSQRLFQEGQLSRADLDADLAEAARFEAQVESRRAVLGSLEADRDRSELTQRALMADSGAALGQLEGRISRARSELAEIEDQIERRSLRAPKSGQLADVASLAPGQVVSLGEHLGTLIAEGTIHVVAFLPPERAGGRVRPGQRAWVRLPGFPWTQYGSLTAAVSRVANEPRDGRIRVELALDETQESQIPVQHGLPATVEIEIEKVAPARLLFRVLGRSLGA